MYAIRSYYERVLPEVPLVHVSVFLDLVVVREDGKVTRVEPEDPLDRVGQSIVPPVDPGRVVSYNFV